MSESRRAPNADPVLAEPLDLGKRVMRNRIVQAPLSVCYAGLDGQVTPKTIAHYARRAAGGTGMVITENFAISDAGRQLPRHGLVSGPQHVPGLTQLARGIQSHGALAVLQVVHAGRYAGPWEQYDARRRLAPSAVEFPLTADRLVTPAEMTHAEIDEVIEHFVRAAMLARQAGFDGIELHGAQGFLLSSFQSPRMNYRSDEYGGNFAGRVRLTLEVTQAVVEAVGDDMLVGFHLMSDEMMPGGWEPSDAVRLAQLIGNLGVDFIAPIPTTFESLRDQRSRGNGDPTVLRPEVFRSISEVTTVPLFANGGLGHPATAESVVAEDVAAAVMLGRAVLTDPDWANKHLGRNKHPLVTCRCEPPTCLATQISGAICHAWSPDDQTRGYVGAPAGKQAPTAQATSDLSEESSMFTAPRNYFVTPVLPYAADGSIDEGQYRNLLRRFLEPRYVEAGMGLVANPEAGEIFYLDRSEKRRIVEITVEEASGRVPVYAGVIATTTAGAVEVAKDAAAAGAQGLFVMPPIGALDVTTSWDAAAYPEVFTDLLHAITSEVGDLPMIVHPTCAPTSRYGIGIPATAAKSIIDAVPQIVGWKMTYNYEGYRELTRVLRRLKRPVSILGAPAVYFHENLATGAFDGTATGSWNYAPETMLDHIEAWKRGDINTARSIWENGLAQLQEYIYSENSRLHIRYKTACWLRGFIASPVMRSPLPRPRPEEIATLAPLLTAAGLSVIDETAIETYVNGHVALAS